MTTEKKFTPDPEGPDEFSPEAIFDEPKEEVLPGYERPYKVTGEAWIIDNVDCLGRNYSDADPGL